MTHPLSIQPVGWDSPPETNPMIEAERAVEEFVDAQREYQDRKEDLRIAIEDLKKIKNELIGDFGYSPEDLESVLNEKRRGGVL